MQLFLCSRVLSDRLWHCVVLVTNTMPQRIAAWRCANQPGHRRPLCNTGSYDSARKWREIYETPEPCKSAIMFSRP